jgi:hypothetical protein
MIKLLAELLGLMLYGGIMFWAGTETMAIGVRELKRRGRLTITDEAYTGPDQRRVLFTPAPELRPGQQRLRIR